MKMQELVEYLPTVRWATFGLSLFGVVAILVVGFGSTLVEGWRFFPAPKRETWQYRAFRLFFRCHFYALVVLTLMVWEPLDGARGLFQYLTGAALLVVGFGVAFRITFQMGWRNAFGEKRGLVTDGWFRFSRNPIYVATWIGLFGWGLIASSLLVSILLALWALMYVLAPLAEEPWLEREYGQAYLDYKARTPRFI